MNNESPDFRASPPSVPFEQINAVCDMFTANWTKDKVSDISSYLDQVADGSQETLLRNLLRYEIVLRREQGEQPLAEEYIKRFPKYADLVRHVFLQSSTFSSASGLEELRTIDWKRPAANMLGDYRLVRELGRGGMGFVYEAVHTQRGHHVALKTLPAVDGTSLHRFKREFRSAADINHPNLIGLHTLESDGAQWFFTMDLIEGCDFHSYVRTDDNLDETRLRAALSQLVAGVMALHGNHMIHRDLKPSNVMVTNTGHVIVLDFGLVLEADQSQTGDKIMGTVAYMAPEQAASLPVTAASDWYAVGVILYEALCGARPFSGPGLQVLQDKQQMDPPPLPKDSGIPADLGDLCMKLLQRDPEQRPDAFEIAKVISAQAATPSIVTTTGEHLVGRETQLRALDEAFTTLRDGGEPVMVSISGRSGEGKTSLAEHFLGRLRKDPHVTVLSGRCYDRESVPFKALDSLIDALCSHLRSLPEKEVARLISRDITMLAHLFPVLQRVPVIAEEPKARITGLDEQQVRNRAFAAFRELLLRISDRTPIVLFIDDIQWGDADSAEVLFEVMRPPEAPAVLFLNSFRSDEVANSSFLRQWEELQRKNDVRMTHTDVKVGPLTLEDCTSLVLSLVGKDTETVRRRAVEFYQETGGNPYLLVELVGCFDADADSFRPMPIHEVIEHKLQKLPEGAEQLLNIVAVSGQALAIEEVYRTAGRDASALATLTHMRNERLVRMIGPDENPMVDTYHDKIRETALGSLNADSQKGIHRTLAETIERQVGCTIDDLSAALEREPSETADGQGGVSRVYDLAFHFDAAGEPRKAFTYSLLAAEQARRQFAPEVAAEQYAIAERNFRETSADVRYRLAEGYGAALILLGRYEDAVAQLDGAIDLTDVAERKARIEALQGELSVKQGRIDKSIEICESGIRRLGIWVPRSQFGVFFGLILESIVQCSHTLLPFRLHKRPSSYSSDLTMRLTHGLIYPYAFQNMLRLVWTHLKCMNCAERVPRSQQLAVSYGMHACLMSMLGWQARGNRYREQATVLVGQLDDIHARGVSSSYQGIGCYASGQYAAGLERLNDAIGDFENAGDPFELHLAQFHRGCCYFGMGNLVRAVADARATFASSARIGDSRVLCSSYLWARATSGNIPFEELKSCYPNRPDDVMSTVHGIMAEGHWHTFNARTEDALLAFERAGEMIRKSLFVNSHMIVVLPELVGALRRHADTVQDADPKQCDQLRRRAYRLAKWATRLTWLFPAAYPLALRERSRILAVYGKTKIALKFAEKSCTVAKQQNAKYEYAQSFLVRGKLAKELGIAEADEQIRTAEAAIEAMERPVRELAKRNFADLPNAAQSPSIDPANECDATAAAQPKPSRRFGWIVVGLLALVGIGILLGHLAGSCIGYVAGFVVDSFHTNSDAWAPAVNMGAFAGRILFPVVLLICWPLIRSGRRHYEAVLARSHGETPSPPPAAVRYALFILLGTLALNLSMIPPALGIWFGGMIGNLFGVHDMPWGRALSALGGVVGLALPLLVWRSAK